MPRVPAHLCKHALGMLQGGMRTADVARAINCNVCTVRRLRQGDRTQWQTTCNNTCTGSVHPNSTPAEQVQDGNNNCPSYTRNLQSSISAQTARNRLREAGLRACRPVVRQVLTRHHRQQRRLWAQTQPTVTGLDRTGKQCSSLTSFGLVSPGVMV